MDFLQLNSKHFVLVSHLPDTDAPRHLETYACADSNRKKRWLQRARQWVNSLGSTDRGDHMSGCGGATMTLNPLVFTLNSRFHFDSLLSYSRPPPNFIPSRLRRGGEHQFHSVKMRKQLGGTGNQRVNKPAGWVNNWEQRPCRGSFDKLIILLYASYT